MQEPYRESMTETGGVVENNRDHSDHFFRNRSWALQKHGVVWKTENTGEAGSASSAVKGRNPLHDAFLDVAKMMPGEYRLFLEEMAGRIGERSGIAFEVIFRECAFKCLPMEKISPEEQECLLSLGEKLGYLDKEMQVAQLTLLEEELRERIRELKSGMPKQQKMYQSMGILGGILLAVLMW